MVIKIVAKALLSKYLFYDFNLHFKFINSRVDSFQKQILRDRKLPLSHQELSYIALVGNYPQLSLTPLGALDFIAKSTFSNQIKALEHWGYVRYAERLERDKREKHLQLTPRGAEALAIYPTMRQQFFDRYFCRLSDEKLRALSSIKSKLVALMIADVKPKGKAVANSHTWAR